MLVYVAFKNSMRNGNYCSKKIRMFYWLMVLLVFIPAYDSRSDRIPTHNLCPKTTRYTEDVIISETKLEKESYGSVCWHILPSCELYRWVNKTHNKIVPIEKTKIEFDCCDKYENKNGRCLPICELGCGKGNCIAPDFCRCEEGWKQPYCHTECEEGKFGSGCKDTCFCANGAACDKKTGFCRCLPGYAGEYCERVCPEGTFGENCSKQCLCKNGGICDIAVGSCECQSGYEGVYCEKPCSNYTHGKSCEKTCVCIPENTEACHHVDGVCICNPGYQGLFCEKECYQGKYGPFCEKECNCSENSHLCQPIRGECICDPGWTGPQCTDKCLPGSFGEDCQFRCAFCTKVSGICDHITGFCNCPPGRHGDFCELDCSPGQWGSNCSNICDCGFQKNCHSKSGVCLCSPGENNSLCSQDCADRTHGFNCSLECSCTCDIDSGICTKNESHLSQEMRPRINSVTVTIVTIFLILGCLVFAIFCFTKYEMVKSGFQKLKGICCCYRSDRSGNTTADAINNPDVLPVVAHFSNPLYGAQTVHLSTAESIQNPRLSLSGRCYSNMLYDLGNEGNGSEKTDGNEKKDSDITNRPAAIDISSTVGDFFQKRRFSRHGPTAQSDSTYSSTAELEEAYEPEQLSDFNVPENIC